MPPGAQEQYQAMAASEGGEEAAIELQEGVEWDTIRGLHSRLEVAVIPIKETEEGRVAAVMVDAEAAVESGVGEKAAPALAD